MEFLQRLRRLWKRPLFRRMVILRLFSQGGDAVMQLGMASYVIFNPQSQASGPRVALVYALTILPFTFIGPFLSPLLDHFSRQRIVILSDATRIVLSLTSAAAVATGFTAGRGEILLLIFLLVALSINRLQLAALGAALPFTIADDEYIEATGLLPVIGPLAAIGGGLFAAAIRLFAGPAIGANLADALIFLLSGLLLLAALLTTLGFSRTELGPSKLSDGQTRRTNAPELGQTFRQVISGLEGASRHLWQRRPACYAIATVFAARIIWGALSVMVILLYRHYFNDESNLEKAMIEMGVWFGLAGAGFALCGVLVTSLTHRFGVRNSIALLLGASAVAQLLPLIEMSQVWLLISGFLIGWFAQSIKTCGDTVVQTHVSDYWRGRVMVLYDIFNNLGIVIGALLAGFLLPANGYSPGAVLLMSGWFAFLTALFLAVTRLDPKTYDKGAKVRPQTR